MTNNPISNDPVSLNPKPKQLGIKKINRLQVFIVLSLFICLLVFLIFNMSNKQSFRKQRAKAKAEESKIVSSDQPVNETWFKDPAYDDLRVASVKPSPVPVLERSTKDDNESVNWIKPLNPDLSSVSLEPLNNPLSLESQKSFNDAVKSVGVASDNGFESSSINKTIDSTYMRESNQGNFGVTARSENNLTEKEKFLKEGVLPGEYLPNTLKDVVAPYVLQAGSFIPAALETGINSETPGYIKARVTQNVYDTVTGEYLLIPQGSVLIGQYKSSVDFGDSRVIVVFQRLIFPNGKNIDLEKMAGTDTSGYSGFKDKVNNHWFRLYSSAFLMSVFGAGYELINKDDGNNEKDTSFTVASQVSQQIAQVSNEVIRKNLNDVSPTLEIRQGTKFLILAQKDILLEPWSDYE